MEVGSNWSEDITNAVRTSGSVIVCISENYISSSLCTKEVRLGKEIGKTIIPLVLPETEHKENVWDKIVGKHYASANPPHTIASEIAGSTWIDFRGYGKGEDPNDQASFEAKYQIPLQHVRDQISNLRNTGFLWDLSHEWEFTFFQDPEYNNEKVSSFKVTARINHQGSNITGGCKVISPKGATEAHIEGAAFEGSLFSWSIQCNEEDLDEPTAQDEGQEEEEEEEEEEEGEGEEEGEDEEGDEGGDDEEEEEDDTGKINEFAITSVLSHDGQSIEGTWIAFPREWCSGSGKLIGKRAQPLQPRKK